MEDRRIGKQYKKPNPKCPDCGTFMHQHTNLGGSTGRWECDNCKSQYEEIR